jgi:hypothetical protein
MDKYKFIRFSTIVLAALAVVVPVAVLALSGRLFGGAAPSMQSVPLNVNLQAIQQRRNGLYDFPRPLFDRLGASNLTPQNATGSTAYTNYVRVTDDIEAMSLQVPIEWNDIQTGTWTVRGRDVGLFIKASADLNHFASSDEPGVFFGVSRELADAPAVSNPALTLNPAILRLLSDQKANRQGRCRDSGRFAYQDNFFRGDYDLYLDCTEGGVGEIVLVTMPAHQSYLTFLRINLRSADDLYAATHILESYQVLNGSLADEHEDHAHD